MGQTQLDRVEEKLDTLIQVTGERAIDTEGRLKALETTQKNAGTLATWVAGIVAAVVTFTLTRIASVLGTP